MNSRNKDELDLRLHKFDGDTLRNAIPREAFATITLPNDKASLLQACSSTYLQTIQQEFGSVEANLTMNIKK